jgi:hypothetical protein
MKSLIMGLLLTLVFRTGENLDQTDVARVVDKAERLDGM